MDYLAAGLFDIITPLRFDFVHLSLSLSLSYTHSHSFSISTLWFLNTHGLPLRGNYGTEDFSSMIRLNNQKREK